jgi:hypothetical protein
MNVHVHAAGQDVGARGVDLPPAVQGAAELDDPAIQYADVAFP